MPTALDIVTSALLEINVLAAGETASAEDANWALQKLQRLIDKLNAVRQAIYTVNFTKFTLIANHTPHTIGPGGDFNVTQRPVRIVAASFILNAGSGSNEVDAPQLHIRDDSWWAAQPVKQLTSSICTDLYYSPDVPLGNLFFWPICNVANPVRLEMWTNINSPLALADTLYFPQAYWDAIILTLAVEMGSTFGHEPSPSLWQRQRDALKILMANNAEPPRISTDGGMPSPFPGAGRPPDFDFLTGLNDNR